MNAQLAILILCAAAAFPAHAGNLDMLDADVLKQQQLEWRRINMDYLKLKLEYDKAKKQWTPLAGAEAERDVLVKRIEQATQLVSDLSKRRYRTWTSTSGAKLYACAIFQNETYVRLKNEKGEEVEIQLVQLSESDQGYLTRVARALEPQAAPAEDSQQIMGLDDTKTKIIRVKP